MQYPLRMKPLALCDPNTVNRKDHVPVALTCDKDASFGYIRYNPNQKWYYYPEMTNDEVMVFK